MLIPIITSPSFHVHGEVVHCAMIRLADVMQSKPDYQRHDMFQDLPPTDEDRPWIGVDVLQRSVGEVQDPVEFEDAQEPTKMSQSS